MKINIYSWTKTYFTGKKSLVLLAYMNALAINYVLVFVISFMEFGINLQTVVGENYHQLHDGRERSNDFSNQWIVHLDGSSEAAELLSMKLGYKNLGEVSIIHKEINLQNFIVEYHF